ncbi:L,D-transpeptidase [Hoeflea prorocentri]|uniref:L,D-transpeptidase n=1 Tax=Hoeflea prorocentri TaxID=1922333 RepID=A0A9X3UIS8_9HYPH|nr:L,D-transpeptidase [Hoeflea prorocentri]MCY6381371.1 L,D-transpeptidase [Hoeflea prorocentri]MDA5399171.1 L,D-transpeptidase [Hoeflea prorocentri]
MKRVLSVFILSVVILALLPLAAEAATLTARIDLSSQTMVVTHRGKVKYHWKVSTGRRGYYTPTGSYSPKWLSKHHRSRKYNNAPMPFAIFFRGGYAVHGTNEISRLGRPASHGCVRLDPRNAATLFSLVQREGFKNTRIIIRK